MDLSLSLLLVMLAVAYLLRRVVWRRRARTGCGGGCRCPGKREVTKVTKARR